MEENRNIVFFNLNKDGDFANVKILHKTLDTIEHAELHWITNGTKKRIVKCIENDCPLCQSNNPASHRIFIHLYDYADNMEKVWSRTDKILPQLKEIIDSWGDLSRCVLRITRVGNDFPKYTINVLNPEMFPEVPAQIMQTINTNVGFRCYSTRSKEELQEYLRTGILPERKKQEYRPKESASVSTNNDFRNNTNISNNNFSNNQQTTEVKFTDTTPEDVPFNVPVSQASTAKPQQSAVADDPFSMFAPRKV